MSRFRPYKTDSNGILSILGNANFESNAVNGTGLGGWDGSGTFVSPPTGSLNKGTYVGKLAASATSGTTVIENFIQYLQRASADDSILNNLKNFSFQFQIISANTTANAVYNQGYISFCMALNIKDVNGNEMLAQEGGQVVLFYGSPTPDVAVLINRMKDFRNSGFGKKDIWYQIGFDLYDWINNQLSLYPTSYGTGKTMSDVYKVYIQFIGAAWNNGNKISVLLNNATP